MQQGLSARKASLTVLAGLRRYAEESERIVEAHGSRHGLVKSDLRALGLIMERHQQGLETTPSEISRQLGISSASTTALVDRLTRAGYAQRRPSENDRRSVHVVVTQSALSAGQEIFRPVIDATLAALDGFSDEELDVAARVLTAANDATLSTIGPDTICSRP